MAQVGSMGLVSGYRAFPQSEADDTVSREHHHQRQEVDEDKHDQMIPGGKAADLGGQWVARSTNAYPPMIKIPESHTPPCSPTLEFGLKKN